MAAPPGTVQQIERAALGHARESLSELEAKYALTSAYQVAQVYAWRGERSHRVPGAGQVEAGIVGVSRPTASPI
jgi:hypothetical protein